MPNYLNKNGETYSKQELMGYAQDENLSFDDYMKTKSFEIIEDKPDSKFQSTGLKLLDQIIQMDSNEQKSDNETESEVEDKPTINSFFKDVIPAAADATATRNTDVSQYQIASENPYDDYQGVDEFASNENLEQLHKDYPGVKFNKVGLGNGTITVKLPGQKSPRPFKVPDDDEGLSRLKFNINQYITAKKDKDLDIDSELNNSIDNIWQQHSKKWDAEDLMSDELGKLLGSGYTVKTSGTLGNEFTVIDNKDDSSIDIMVGGADKFGNNQTSDVLKRWLATKHKKFESTPEYKEDVKEITRIANEEYLLNPASLNEIFERNNITNFSNIATAENKEALVQHILGDQNALGGIFSNARDNFDNLTNFEIDEILHNVVNSHVSAEWDC